MQSNKQINFTKKIRSSKLVVLNKVYWNNLQSEEVDESNKNGTSEVQKDVALENAENVVSETHALASEPAEDKEGVMDREITDETTPAKPEDVQGTVVVNPQALTKDEDKDAASAEPKDPEAIIIGTPQENAALSEANVEPEDSKAKVQVEAQDIDAIVKEATIIATPQENPAPLVAQENDATVTKPEDNEATVTAANAEPVEPVDTSATKSPKEKKKGDVFHTLFSMYDNLVKKKP